MPSAKIINVKDTINSKFAINDEGAKLLYEAIENHFKAKEIVCLSFEGIDYLISHFIHHTLGKLLKTNTLEDIYKYIKFIDIKLCDLETIYNTLDSAERWYGAKEREAKN